MYSIARQYMKTLNNYIQELRTIDIILLRISLKIKIISYPNKVQDTKHTKHYPKMLWTKLLFLVIELSLIDCKVTQAQVTTEYLLNS